MKMSPLKRIAFLHSGHYNHRCPSGIRSGIPELVSKLRNNINLRVETIPFEDRNEIEFSDFHLVLFLPTFDYIQYVEDALQVKNKLNLINYLGIIDSRFLFQISIL